MATSAGAAFRVCSRPGTTMLGLSRACSRTTRCRFSASREFVQDGLGHFGASIDTVATIAQDLGFNDRNEVLILADRGVARERFGVGLDRQPARQRAGYVVDGAPFANRAPCCL